MEVSVSGSSPWAEVRLHAAEAHHRDLQAGGLAVVARRPEGSGQQQWRAQGGAQGGAQASAQPAEGGHLRVRGVLALGS